MKCLYDKWFDGEVKNINNFHLLLFKAVQAADATNRAKIITAFPELFKDSHNL
jgi:2-oxo-4-hydroxy-4-carboxy--5-ureidoimidazoline (OHCU) decarboxylase